jgi:hypothetical protein
VAGIWPEYSSPSTTPTPLSGSIYPFNSNTGVFYFPEDYTIEGFGMVSNQRLGWLFQISDTVNHFGVVIQQTTPPTTSVSIYLNSSTPTATFSINQFTDFTHFALVRKGSRVEFLVNGFLQWNTISSVPHGYSSKSFFTIGSYNNPIIQSGASHPSTVTISNFRVVKGRAIYDSASSFSFGSLGDGSRILPFDPPPKTLDPIPGTLLLTCQDAVLKDNSGNNFNVSCVNRGAGGNLVTFNTLSEFTPINQVGEIQRTRLALLPGNRQTILSNPVGSNKNLKVNSLRIFTKNVPITARSFFYWETGVIDADSKVNIIASSQFLKSTANDGTDFSGGKNFIGELLDKPIYLSPGTTLYGAAASETSFTGTIAYEEIA